MTNIKSAESASKYICESCNFTCSKYSNYTRHLSTAKHKILINTKEKEQQVPKVYVCDCGKEYKHSSSLCKHKAKCKSINSENEVIRVEKQDNDRYELLTNTILELVKKNDELTSSIVEITKQIGNNNNNTINSNNKFNLNVFLNEKCKNAMTLTDFVKSINLTVENFIETGERGFIDGISNIIVERINSMELHDRPLHCTDLKRETVYIKEAEKWEKDEDKNKLRKAVKWVANKNERMRPIWYEQAPGVDVMGTENYEKFFKYSESSLGGCGREETKLFEDKVMKNVLKEVTIDKDLALNN